MNMFFKKNNNFILLSTKFVWTNFADATLGPRRGDAGVGEDPFSAHLAGGCRQRRREVHPDGRLPGRDPKDASHTSDLSPMRLALDAKIVATPKVLMASDFFTTGLAAKNMLDKDELATAIRCSGPKEKSGCCL
jgi:hypothetical protein